MQKIVPDIWCNRNAEAVAAAYTEVFSAAGIDISARTVAHYPAEGLPEFQQSFAGQPLVVTVDLDGFEITLINAGDEFRPGAAISFMLNFDPLLFGSADAARAALDAVYEGLAAGGEVRMPLQEYPFSPRYSWVEDRFGVNWQLILTDPAGEPRPFVMPAFMFGGIAQNRTVEATDDYLEIFPEAALGTRVHYPAQQGPASPEAVMFSDFRLADQWFVAMDSGVEQDSSFSPGFSLEIRCADQAEIDHFWEALSAVPEAEQCGWLQDRYGVSWQVVPENMGELMARPGAYEHMLQMKKLVIADF